MRDVLARTRPPGRRVLRFFGASESAVAQALVEAGGDGDGVEATICARDFEIHVDLVVEPGAETRGEELAAALRSPLERYLFSEDERTIAELVLELCRRAWAAAGDGRVVHRRDGRCAADGRAGSSDVVLGGVVAYADEVKTAELGVPEALLREHGAVSAEVAAAMAKGVRARLGADVGIAVTGVAGPGRRDRRQARRSRPLPCLVTGRRRGARSSRCPADRPTIRARATVAALHLARRVLTRTRHEDV